MILILAEHRCTENAGEHLRDQCGVVNYTLRLTDHERCLADHDGLRGEAGEEEEKEDRCGQVLALWLHCGQGELDTAGMVCGAVWNGVWGSLEWCVGQSAGMVCGAVCWNGVWGSLMEWCVGQSDGMVCGAVWNGVWGSLEWCVGQSDGIVCGAVWNGVWGSLMELCVGQSDGMVCGAV